VTVPSGYVWTRVALAVLLALTVAVLGLLAIRAGVPADLISHAKVAVRAVKAWWVG
jgi:hypothetical protein